MRGFLDEDVAPMPIFGRGYKAHVTSSCHDEYGKRNLIDISALDNFIRKLSNKILKHKDEITIVECDYEGAETVLVSYGAVARAAAMASFLARKKKGFPSGDLPADYGLAIPRRRDRQDGQESKTCHRVRKQSGSDLPLH